MSKQFVVTPVDSTRTDAWMRTTIAALVVLAVVFAFGRGEVVEAARSHREVHRSMLALVPGADGTAVAVWDSTTFQRDTRQWIGRHRGQGLVWSAEVPGLVQTINPQHGIAIGEDVIVYRYLRHGGRSVAVRALAMGDGALLWETEIVHFDDSATSREHFTDADGLYVSLLIAGHQVIAARGYDESHHDLMVTLDLHTGQTVSTDSVRNAISPRHIGDRTVVGALGDILSWGPLPGPPTRHDAHVVCELDGRPVTVSGGWTEPYLLTRLDDQGAAHLVASEELEEGWPVQCADYNGDLVVLIELEASAWGSSAVVVFRPDGTLRHAIAIPGRGYWSGSNQATYPDVASLSGRLTRYVPFFENHYPDPGALLMIDLENGAIAWRSPAVDFSGHGDMFRAGTTWFWTPERSLVIRFDGTTGRLTSASRVHGDGELRGFGPNRLGAGSFWLYAKQWRPDLVIARLDSETLRIDGGVPFDTVDVTREVRELLGDP